MIPDLRFLEKSFHGVRCKPTQDKNFDVDVPTHFRRGFLLCRSRRRARRWRVCRARRWRVCRGLACFRWNLDARKKRVHPVHGGVHFPRLGGLTEKFADPRVPSFTPRFLPRHDGRVTCRGRPCRPCLTKFETPESGTGGLHGTARAGRSARLTCQRTAPMFAFVYQKTSGHVARQHRLSVLQARRAASSDSRVRTVDRRTSAPCFALDRASSKLSRCGRERGTPLDANDAWVALTSHAPLLQVSRRFTRHLTKTSARRRPPASCVVLGIVVNPWCFSYMYASL